MKKKSNGRGKKECIEIIKFEDKKAYLQDYYRNRDSNSTDSMYILLYLSEERSLLKNIIIRDINEAYVKSDCLVYHLDILEEGNNYFIEYRGEVEKSGEEIIGDLKNLIEIKNHYYEIHLYSDITKLESDLETGINIVEDEFELTEDYFKLLKSQYKFYKEIDVLLDDYNSKNDSRIKECLKYIDEIKGLLQLRTNYKKEMGKYLRNDLRHYN